jgi:hypothetical protein
MDGVDRADVPVADHALAVDDPLPERRVNKDVFCWKIYLFL